MAGGFCAIFVIMLVEHAGLLASLPSGDNDKQVQIEAFRKYLPKANLGVLLTLPFAWSVGTMTGAFLAVWLTKTKHLHHAIAVGSILTLGGAHRLYTFPYPSWMWAGLIAFPIGAYLGSRLALKNTPQTEEEPNEDST
ncbi:MAG: hypothetical protein CMO66_02735 [Verrucomicrobiales bacterium]|nr:hypothetical protein [Verrucomicrobiales bacterium]